MIPLLILLFITAISTSMAGPLERRSEGLRHGFEVRANLDALESYRLGDPTSDSDLETLDEPGDDIVSTGSTGGYYSYDGNGQSFDLASPSRILLASAGFNCQGSSSICCDGQNDGNVRPCDQCKYILPSTLTANRLTCIRGFSSSKYVPKPQDLGRMLRLLG